MSTEQEPAISEVQLQQLTSPKLTLWDIQISGDTYAYFHEGFESPPTNKITMRDRVTTSTIRTYEPLPITGGGFEYRAEGSSPRPILTVANVLGSGAGGFLHGMSSSITSNKDLLGKKVYRRTVFLKHTYDNDTSSNPPIEFPIQMYFIDRIINETPMLVGFELVAGFDLEGVKVPRRVVTGSSCPWIYTGACSEKDEEDRVGGCTWSNRGQVKTNNPSTGVMTTYTNFVNSADEPVVHQDAVYSSAWASNTSVTQGQVYKTLTAPTMNRINFDGSITAVAAGGEDYWQYTGPKGDGITSAGTAGAPPSDNSSIWRRVRKYAPSYSSGSDYFVYSLSRYNTYVLDNNQLWVPSQVSQTSTPGHHSSPQHNSYWELGDACSKSLTGCALRYRYMTTTSDSTSVISPKHSATPLQFGGFPGSRKFS